MILQFQPRRSVAQWCGASCPRRSPTLGKCQCCFEHLASYAETPSHVLPSCDRIQECPVPRAARDTRPHSRLPHQRSGRVHVVLSKGTLYCSTCVKPELHSDLDGSEREVQGHTDSKQTWARRLQSSWGPHWRCEELFLDTRREKRTSGSALEIALVCKQM